MEWNEETKKLAYMCLDLSDRLKKGTSFSEVEALNYGVSQYTIKTQNLTRNQIKFLIRDLYGSIINRIIEFPSCAISNNQIELVDSILKINPDFTHLFQFISKSPNANSNLNFNNCNSVKIDPLTFFLFCQDFFTACRESEEHSNIMQFILLHSNDLSVLESFDAIQERIESYFQSQLQFNIRTDEIFQNCIKNAIARRNQNNIEGLRDLRKASIKSIKGQNDFIRQCSEEVEKQDSNHILFENLIHYATLLSQNPALSFNPNSERFVQESINKVFLLAEKSSQFINNNKIPNGFIVLKFALKWEKNFLRKKNHQTFYIKIEFSNFHRIIKLNPNNRSDDLTWNEVVFPYYSQTDEPITLSISYIKNLYQNTPEKKIPSNGYRTLSSIQYSLNSNSQKKSEDNVIQIKRKKGPFHMNCGSIHIQHQQFDPKNKMFPCLNQNIYLPEDENGELSEPIQINDFLEFHISNLVNEWIAGKPYKQTTTGTTSFVMSLYPPSQHYCAILDFAIKYMIPASSIFLKIAEKMLSAWCHSESYLNSFTVMFLTAHASLIKSREQIGPIDADKQLYNNILQFLKSNVPLYLLHHLSMSIYYHKNCLFPLFMLLSFVIPDDQKRNNHKVSTYISKFLTESTKNIILSTTCYLHTSNIQAQSSLDDAQKLVNYLIDDIYTRQNFMSETNQSTNIFDTAHYNFDFSPTAMHETMELLSILIKRIADYYQESILPTFLYSQFRLIKTEIRNFALRLVILFKTQINQYKESDYKYHEFYRFLASYQSFYNCFFYDIDEEEEEDQDFPKHLLPQPLFETVFSNWAAYIGDYLRGNTEKIVQEDNHKILFKNNRTSRAILDLKKVFDEALENLIQFKLYCTDDNLEFFLNLLKQFYEYYIELQILGISQYFPEEIFKNFVSQTLHPFIFKKNPYSPKGEFSFEPILITFNDFIKFFDYWKMIISRFKKEFPSFSQRKSTELNSSHYSKIIKDMLILLSRLISQYITDCEKPKLLICQSIITQIGLQPYEADLNINAFNFSAIILDNFVEKFIMPINNVSHSFYLRKLMRLSLLGLDAGLMNILIKETNESPLISYESLQTIANIFEQVYIDLKHKLPPEILKIITNGDETMSILSDHFAPYTSFLLNNIAKDHQTLIQTINKETDDSKSLCQFIIISSHAYSKTALNPQSSDNSKDLKLWIRSNKDCFYQKRFYPHSEAD